MLTAAALAAWIALAPSHLVDRQGNRFADRQLSHEAADAFATACAESDPFPLDTDGRLCGAFLVVMAGLESGFSLHARGDGGAALGPFQEHFGGASRDASWLTSARHYLATVRTALRACPDQPIAMLAGERCGSSRIHAARWLQVTRVLREVQP